MGVQGAAWAPAWRLGLRLRCLLATLERANIVLSLIAVLDHAEQLVSSTGETVNGLAQLLLLPQELSIHLTFVIITNSVLLEHTGRYLGSNSYPVPLFLSQAPLDF
jgi:hypothetical protein